MGRIRTIIGVGMVVAMAVAHAASFDCGHAEAKAEKLICANPSLSSLDEKLATAYRTVLSGASAERKKLLVAEQRRWVKDVRNGCDDEACLAKAYASRVEHLTSASVQDTSDVPFVRTDVLANHPAPIGKGFPSVIRSIDGDFVYSHYDDNGNTRSIVQLDFTNGRWTNLVSEKTDPALIALDARYIVFHTPHSASFPIQVTDRKIGTTLARVRLARSVQDAFIDGDRLVLFQGQTGAYSFQQSVAILALPSLKLIEETTLPGFKLLGIRGSRIYTTVSANGKRDLMIFDLQFRELGRIQIPQPLDKINSYCDPSIEQPEEDRAVLTANCGELHILDLKSYSVVHSIRRYAMFYSMTLYDRLIFTAAEDEVAGTNRGIVVFDMATGKELARLPISASTIAIKEGALLAAGKPISTGNGASWQMETFQINTDAIRKGRWQESRVVQQCRQAGAGLTEKQDLYGAISLCKEVGIEGYASAGAIPEAVFPALKEYGLWLSQTLDKSSEAVKILERVQAANPDPDVARALSEARVKTKVVGHDAAADLNEFEQRTNFAQVLADGSQIAKATTKTIEFGAFSNLFYFSGDRLYVGRYGCRTSSCDGGATIGVFDRNTLNELASITIAPDDQDYQDAIESIVADDKHIYASVGYRYEQKGRPNFFVIDRNTLQIKKRAQVQPVGRLRLEDGKLVVCRCHFTEEQACTKLDPVTSKVAEVPDKVCVQNEPDNVTILRVDKEMKGVAKFVAVTRSYLVARSGLGSSSEYIFYPRKGGQPLRSVRGQGEELDWPASVDGDEIVTLQATLGSQLVKLVSLPAGTAQTLFGLPATPLRPVVLKLHQQILYVGYGRDLLIFDLREKRFKRYIKDFIPTGFKNNGFGLDANRIDRLIIDRGRLIALTFYGENSRIALLSDL